MNRIVFFTFAGRRANMEIQRPYIEQLLADYPTAEFHLWDLTREESDQYYIRRWAESHERIIYIGVLHPGHPIPCLGDWRGRGHVRCECVKHKPPYERPYRGYRDSGKYDTDTVFVKFDDDVLWMDTDRFGEVLSFLETHPLSIASANVANNAVCAKYEPGLRDEVERQFRLGNPINPDYDRDWWALHIQGSFAETSHNWLANFVNTGTPFVDRAPFRTREGEAVSINFVAMKYPTLCETANAMQDAGGRLGDEGTIDSFLPWIIPNFRVAHLTFGPQDKALSAETLQAIREQYRKEE